FVARGIIEFAGYRKIVVALEFLQRPAQLVGAGVAGGSCVVAQIRQARAPAFLFLDRIQMSNLQRKFDFKFRNTELAAWGRLRNLDLDAALAVRSDWVYDTLHFELAIHIAKRLMVEILNHHAKCERVVLDPEAVKFRGGATYRLRPLVRNENTIARVES